MLDFYAEWCGPCKRIAPDIEKFSEAKDYAGISFGRVDVDNVADVATIFDIEAMPTFVFIHQGKEVADLRVKGASSKQVATNLASLSKLKDK